MAQSFWRNHHSSGKQLVEPVLFVVVMAVLECWFLVFQVLVLYWVGEPLQRPRLGCCQAEIEIGKIVLMNLKYFKLG